jgi:hypothetical protein
MCTANISDGLNLSDRRERLPLDDAPRAYEIFQKKQEGAFKVLLQP